MTQSKLDIARACAEQMLLEDRATQALGIQIDIPAVGEAVATMTIEDEHLNGFGICHGGYIYLLADTAFAFACNAYNDMSVAASGVIDYLRPVEGGTELTATASEDEREGARGHYTVRVRNGQGQLVALFRGHSRARSIPLIK